MRNTVLPAGVEPIPLTCGVKKRAATDEKTIWAVKLWMGGTSRRPSKPGILELCHSIGNVIGVTITLIAMVFLSWQITLVGLALLPIIILPARFVGRRIQAITLESYNLNASMTSMMTERFNVAGALLVKLFGQPDLEIGRFEEKAGRVRDIGVKRAMFTRVFMAAIVLTATLATALTT